MAILLNMGGSCSVCVPLYITKRSEAVLQWGKRKNIKKMMINGELVIEWKKEKSIKFVELIKSELTELLERGMLLVRRARRWRLERV